MTTKTIAELKNLIGANLKGVKLVDKNLADRVAYAINHKATKTDLTGLLSETKKVLGDKFVTKVATPVNAEEKVVKPLFNIKGGETTKKPVEASLKPVEKKEAPKETPKETPKATKVEAKVEPKKVMEKSAKKADGATKPALDDRIVPLVSGKFFPEEIKIGEDTYRIDHEIKSIKDLMNFEVGEIEFAFAWTKRRLRQFSYFNDWLGHPKSFPHDLDTAQLIYVSDEGRVAYAVSDTTEVPYTILPQDFEEIDGVRVAGDIEFHIYKRVEEPKKEIPKKETPKPVEKEAK